MGVKTFNIRPDIRSIPTCRLIFQRPFVGHGLGIVLVERILQVLGNLPLRLGYQFLHAVILRVCRVFLGPAQYILARDRGLGAVVFVLADNLSNAGNQLFRVGQNVGHVPDLCRPVEQVENNVLEPADLLLYPELK